MARKAKPCAPVTAKAAHVVKDTAFVPPPRDDKPKTKVNKKSKVPEIIDPFLSDNIAEIGGRYAAPAPKQPTEEKEKVITSRDLYKQIEQLSMCVGAGW